MPDILRGVLVAPGDDEFLYEVCRICDRKVEFGQVVMIVDQGHAVYVHRTLVFHRTCVARRLAEIPMGQAELDAAIEEARTNGLAIMEALFAS